MRIKRWGGKALASIKRMHNFLQSHIVTYLILIFSIAVFVLAFILQEYLKIGYLNYLEENSISNEDAILSSVKDSVNSSLYSAVEFGSEMAVSSDIYNSISLAQVSPDIGTMDLYHKLSGYDYSNSSSVVSVAIVDQNGLLSQYDRYKTSEKGSMWNSDNEAILLQMHDDVVSKYRAESDYSFPRYFIYTDPGVHSYDKLRVFNIAYPIIGAYSGLDKTEYVLVVTYRMDLFERFISYIEMPGADYIEGYVTDDSGTILYHSDKSFIGKSEKTVLNDEYIRSVSKDLQYFSWNINVSIDETKLKAHVDQIYNNGIMVLGMLLVIYVLIILCMTRWILKPVARISDAIMTVRKGMHRKKIDIEGKNEIWQLADEYNKMIDDLRAKEEEVERQHMAVVESLKNQYQAEKVAMESQISAHFICNTIGVINYEAIDAGDEKVSVLLKKLSNILRYTFDQRCQKVFIGQEVAWIEQYLFLQKERFEDLFIYQIDYDENYSDWPCCKLFLQPFVENSILHGFEGIDYLGEIYLSIHEDNGYLHVKITDNGIGMDDNTEQIIRKIIMGETIALKKRNEIGIGIVNVISRIKRFYGENLKIEFHTGKCNGTAFDFFFPLVTDEEEAESAGEEEL